MKARFVIASIIFILAGSILCRGQHDADPAHGCNGIDIVAKIAQIKAEIKSSKNRVLVSQCCGGIKLFANVKVGQGKKNIVGWIAEDSNGSPLETTEVERKRMASPKSNSQQITETLLIVSASNVPCFIIARKRMVVD